MTIKQLKLFVLLLYYNIEVNKMKKNVVLYHFHNYHLVSENLAIQFIF